MKKLSYIEKCTGFNHNGPAWISIIEFSRTGSTAYFNGMSLKKSAGVVGNFYDIETGDEYWVSGVKKNGQDRHWAGKGTIFVDSNAEAAYLEEIGAGSLNPKIHKLVTIPKTDKSKFHTIENEIFTKPEFDSSLRFKNIKELKVEELEWLVTYYETREGEVKFNKVRRNIRHAKEEVKLRLQELMSL